MRRDMDGAAALVMAVVAGCSIIFVSHGLGAVRVTATMAVVSTMFATRLARSARRHQRFVRDLRARSMLAMEEGMAVRTGSFEGAVFVGGLHRPEIFADIGVMARLTTDERRAVLLHEARHQQRRDPLRMTIESLVRPVVGRTASGRAWLVDRAAAREIDADKYAINNGASVQAISSALLKVGTVGPGFAGFTSVLDQRIAALSGEHVGRPRFAVRWVAVLGLAAVTTLCVNALHTASVLCCP